MYEKFYSLSSRPFQLSPDPRFFFKSTGHKRAQAYMRYGLQQEQGFIVVTGDVGTGKTMLVNNLFSELDEDAVVAAKIVSTNVKDVDLLRLIAAEFGIPFERSAKATLLHKLQAFFKSCRQEGKRVLLVIDEAQNLPRSALEELRMLSNFEYEGLPLVQSFLLGQREFRAILRAPGLEQLRQRVIAAYHLKPLTAAELKAYIEHRMRKVGWDGDPVIEDGCYEQIFQATGGVPRRINTLFDRVLLNGYLDEEHTITTEAVAAVCAEVEAEQGESGDEAVPGPEGADEPPRPASVDEERRRDKDNIERLEKQVAQLQRTIDTMSSQLRARTVQPPPPPPQPGAYGGVAGRTYPVWTIAFSALIGLAVVFSAVGYWMLTS